MIHNVSQDKSVEITNVNKVQEDEIQSLPNLFLIVIIHICVQYSNITKNCLSHAASCTSTSNCEGNEECRGGLCEPRSCSVTGQCPYGKRCDDTICLGKYITSFIQVG